MKFTKMHGLGNDFVIIAGETRLPVEAGKLARNICDRHTGIGADGLVYILPSAIADFRMRILNADGSEAEQCGNAVRCVALYYYERISGARQALTVETQAGVQRVWLEGDGMDRLVRVDMGRPVLASKDIPAAVEGETVVDRTLQVNNRGEERAYTFTAVSMGNPHAVIEVEDARGYPLEQWGPLVETHPYFPNKTNVEFITIRSRDEMDMRVWERGVGQTMACGTGACAALVASVLRGRADRRALVHLKGGDLLIEWNEEDGRVYMTGPAVTVFEGEWNR
ncbi:diaminopimelate epimerase [Salinithrix halophila]|uniref:Diaminopimelate epimerase n=1 Tax=Salinithrix halophila TaxID=1485204 RepID=A0ABV8JFC4_9BACL